MNSHPFTSNSKEPEISEIIKFFSFSHLLTPFLSSPSPSSTTTAQVKKTSAEALHSPPSVHIQSGAGAANRTSFGSTKSDNICLTSGCIHAASSILDKMEDGIEPCDDFYSFACGEFVESTMIPDEKVSVNTFSIIGDKLQEQLRSLISDKKDPKDSKPFNLAKDLYKACMNKTLIEERGLKPLVDITDNLGGWPVVKGGAWDPDSKWTWQWAVQEFRKVGYSMDYIFDFSIGIDLKKSTSRIIDVSRRFIFTVFRDVLRDLLRDVFTDALFLWIS